jgi:hypothetical protein
MVVAVATAEEAATHMAIFQLTARPTVSAISGLDQNDDKQTCRRAFVTWPDPNTSAASGNDRFRVVRLISPITAGNYVAVRAVGIGREIGRRLMSLVWEDYNVPDWLRISYSCRYFLSCSRNNTPYKTAR